MENEINKAIEVLKNGGVILYPTDTIWGLGCDPNNEKALQKIIDIKQRSSDKHFIILVDSERLLQRYVKVIPEVCFDLIDYAVKPLTIVYPKGKNVSKQVLADDGSIGIRIVKNEFCKKLIQKYKSGITSTSPNKSGEPTPVKFEDIDENIKKQIDYIVNLPSEKTGNAPSQIIKIGEKSEVTILRK